jgi:hypothetical protein
MRLQSLMSSRVRPQPTQMSCSLSVQRRTQGLAVPVMGGKGGMNGFGRTMG